MVHYTNKGTLSGTLRTYQEVRIPYTVPYMVHRGLFRPPRTHSMVHSTVSCILDGTFVPFQRHLVTLSGTPLGTQWYTTFHCERARGRPTSSEATMCSAHPRNVVTGGSTPDTFGATLRIPCVPYGPISDDGFGAVRRIPSTPLASTLRPLNVCPRGCPHLVST
jgi:hypothetical protein